MERELIGRLAREEIGAAVFKAQATDLLDRLTYCMPGHEAAEVRRHTQGNAAQRSFFSAR